MLVDSRRAEIPSRLHTLEHVGQHQLTCADHATDHARGADQPAPGRPAGVKPALDALGKVARVRKFGSLGEEALQAALEFEINHCRASLQEPRRRPAPVAF